MRLTAVADRLNARRIAQQVLVTTLTFVVLDFVWLGVLMSGFYKAELGPLARLSGPDFAPVWWAAVAVYVVLVTGVVVFVLPRAEGHPSRAFLFGALFGLVAYGTYDLTAYSVIVGWSLRMTVVDLLWGAVICGISAYVATAVAGRAVAPATPRHHTPRQSLV